MGSFSSFVIEGYFAWVPLLLLMSSISIGVLIGLKCKWSTALYFFIWNIIIWLTFLFAYDPIWSSIEKSLRSAIDKNNLDAQHINVNPLLEGAKDAFHLLFLSVVLVIANLVALAFLPLFRFIRTKVTKADKNAGRRWYASMPIALFTGVLAGSALHASSEVVTVKSLDLEKNWIYKTTLNISKGLTFNVRDGIGHPTNVQNFLAAYQLLTGYGDWRSSPLGRLFDSESLLNPDKNKGREFTTDERGALALIFGDPIMTPKFLDAIAYFLNGGTDAHKDTKAPNIDFTPFIGPVVAQMKTSIDYMLGGDGTGTGKKIDIKEQGDFELEQELLKYAAFKAAPGDLVKQWVETIFY